MTHAIEQKPMITLSSMALALTTVGCAWQSGSADHVTLADGPSVTLSRVSIVEYEGALRIWEATAFRVRYDNKIADLEQVVLRVFRKNVVAFLLGAPTATFNPGDGTLILAGPVSISALDGNSTLKASRVRWQAHQGKLIADGPVVLRRGESWVEGGSLEVDAVGPRVRMWGDVRARLKSYPNWIR